MKHEQLKLENQLCFPIYAASRLITRQYQPHLDKLGITYPQYLVLLVLWENDGLSVNHIAQKLLLNTNTITPLLKRMEQQELLSRQRSQEDERKVIIKLSQHGQQLKEQAKDIPEKLAQQICNSELNINDLQQLKSQLNSLISTLNNNK